MGFAEPKARPASFDRSTQHRRAMTAKIHVARKQLSLDEDDYRQALLDETGQMSLTTCSDAQLEKFLGWLRAKGFKPLPKSRAAQHPVARKARALWISLYHLGEVQNPSDQALEAFAKRQLGCDRLVWARQSDGYRLIEALKAMAERAGWPQRGDRAGQAPSSLDLQKGLCSAIMSRLQKAAAVPEHWAIEDAAFRLCGIDAVQEHPFTVEHYARIAGALGKVLRESGGKQGTVQ